MSYIQHLLWDVFPNEVEAILSAAKVNPDIASHIPAFIEPPAALSKYSPLELEALRLEPWAHLNAEQQEIRKYFKRVNENQTRANRARALTHSDIRPVEMDWEAIERDYVQGCRNARGHHVYPTHETLAERYACNIGTLRAKARKQQWTLKRNLFRQKLNQYRETEFIGELLTKGTNLDEKHLTQIETMHEFIDTYFEDVRAKAPEQGIDVKGLESVMRIIKEAHALAKDITQQGQMSREEAKKFIEEMRTAELVEMARQGGVQPDNEQLARLKAEIAATEARKRELLGQLN